MQRDKILVLDFGSQYTHLLARRFRQLGFFSIIVEPDTPIGELKGARGIVLSGGPGSVYEKDSPKTDPGIFELGIPILGLCYGHQLIAKELGGKVVKGEVREYGSATLDVANKKGLFSGLKDNETVWMSHGDYVEELPPGFEVIGQTGDCKTAAVANFKDNMFGLQFHPEVTHTPNGLTILKNFAAGICKCKKDWNIEDYLKDEIVDIRETVGDRRVFLLASGGVDSTVCLALLAQAIGHDRISALHIDHGFMRKNESKEVKSALLKLGIKELEVIDASEEFFKGLKGVIDPEEKREIIGNLFIEVANNAIDKLGLNSEDWVLCQGTIYPDTIETARTKHAARIKTHHNRVAFMQELIEQGKVIEPINQLYKDEVRELGLKLGLPRDLVMRHPFPGPGLAIRILCSGAEEVELDPIKVRANEITKRYKLDAHPIPLKSVGIQGDLRTYAHVLAISGKADWKTLEVISTTVSNEIREINRVVYLLHPKRIDNAKVMAKQLTKDRVELLREADHIVNEIVIKHDLMETIWQFPVVLLPVGINSDKESICLRPVFSQEAMTAKFAPLEKEVTDEFVRQLSELDIGAVFYDITHKPPGTIEWE